ncbi:hypothetical protein Tco_1018133 [Tanacetum coccineum]|uniref:Uncharacterized protein n=1 Tax=Tanacetum coccineum TaxID=301880 RepID=A0ABQ5FUX8_9ASTR
MTGDLEEPWSKNGVPYQLCDHICEPYRFKNGKVKWPTCSADIDGFCNGGELPGMVRVGCMTYFQDHKWYDKLADGVLKEEALIHKARFEESWGVNYGANNAGDTQVSQGHKKEHEGNEHTLSSKPTHDPSVCRVRRFKMIKYSFDADDEYVAIKEHEYFDHSRTNIDACQAYRELFRIMDEGWLAAIRRIFGFGIRRIDSLYRPCCKEIDELVTVYSGKRRVLNASGILIAASHTFAQEHKLENHPEQNVRSFPSF